MKKYLLFNIFTYPNLMPIRTVAQDIFVTIGSTGVGQYKLGFSVGPLAFDHTDDALVQIISDSFSTALEFDMAVMFHFDDSMFWLNRPDLWQNAENIEWTSWDGTEAGARVVPWYAGPLAPQMCYNSPAIEAAIGMRVAQVIGPAIQKGLAQLAAAGKSELFAGIIVGWETQLPDVPLTGYHALMNLGYSATNPPASEHNSLVGVVSQFLEFWCQQFIAAGLCQSKLFTHIGVNPPGAADNHAPIFVAFQPNSNAGFTLYGTQGQALPQIVAALQVQQNTTWGVSEGSNLYPPNALPGGNGFPDAPMSLWLSEAFICGASYVNLFGWKTGTPFERVLTAPDAIQVFRRFLSG